MILNLQSFLKSMPRRSRRSPVRALALSTEVSVPATRRRQESEWQETGKQESRLQASALKRVRHCPDYDDSKTCDPETCDPTTHDPKTRDPKEAGVREAGGQEARVQEAGNQKVDAQANSVWLAPITGTTEISLLRIHSHTKTHNRTYTHTSA